MLCPADVAAEWNIRKSYVPITSIEYENRCTMHDDAAELASPFCTKSSAVPKRYGPQWVLGMRTGMLATSP